MLAGSEGDPRRDHRGVGARAAAPRAPRSAGVRFARLRRGRRVRARDLASPVCTRPTAACSTRGEARLTMAGDGAHALLVLGFESTDHPVDERDGARARDLRRARRRAAEAAARRRRGRRRRRLAGARRSWARPTCATCSSRWGCSPRPSRRRSPGSASRRFHERVHAAGERGAARGVRRAGQRVLPLHARLPRRPGALLHGARARRAAARRSSSGARSSAAVSDAIIAAGRRRSPTTTRSGAITAPGMTASGPSPFAAALRGAKAAVDPAGRDEPRRADRWPRR